MQAARAANSALQNEIMLLQARLSDQNEILRRSSQQENLSGVDPPYWSQGNRPSADTHVTGDQTSLRKAVPSAFELILRVMVLYSTGLRQNSLNQVLCHLPRPGLQRKQTRSLKSR